LREHVELSRPKYVFRPTTFIDGNQYNANVTGRDPINDTPFLTPYFIGRNSERLFMLDRNMSGVTVWNSLITRN